MAIEDEYLKYLVIVIPAHIHFNFVNKLSYYDLSTHEVLHILIEKFNNGDFDNLFLIPED